MEKEGMKRWLKKADSENIDFLDKEKMKEIFKFQLP